MKVNELTFDEKNKVFINPEKVIDYSDGQENEQYVLDCLKKAKDTSIFSMELHNCIKDWPSEYHFTTYRANILRPVKIDKGHSVLEIGAGTGAITRYLGETGAKVIAVEGGFPRAKCIAERCRDLDNVTVVCSNVEDVEFDQKFDVITLIGVFEYTAKYSNHENPFYDALRSYGNLLKPGGRLVIAIENKLGLKYFGGFNEDHFGKPYFGIESRYGKKDITTFGHEEIKNMLAASGYNSIKFLFPFPDYKLPKTIIADNGLEHSGFNEADLIRLTKERHYGTRPKANLLNEYLSWESIAENKLVKDFSNSFLIVASKEAEPNFDSTLLAEFYTCGRLEPYNTITRFKVKNNGVIGVDKGLLNATSTVSNNDFAHRLTKETNYIQGKNMHHLIMEALLKNQYDKYEKLMRDWVDHIRSVAVLEDSEPERVGPEYFDALPRNIIIDEKGKLHLFDQEWTINQEFDLSFLLVRYLAEHRRKRGVYFGYASSFLDFVNKSMLACGLKVISNGRLKELMEKDETIRRKINREGGITPRRIFKSFLQLLLQKAKEIKTYVYYDQFAQR
ncbi:class I SAM-dependent methyltransferase [Maribacter algicola]|uniref:Class I SAM-dependent methyltransferase n=1 Tax=Meishania litoralis TaxID=3434685 RepID=A0ACC7LHX8_9FLAO